MFFLALTSKELKVQSWLSLSQQYKYYVYSLSLLEFELVLFIALSTLPSGLLDFPPKPVAEDWIL